MFECSFLRALKNLFTFLYVYSALTPHSHIFLIQKKSSPGVNSIKIFLLRIIETSQIEKLLFLLYHELMEI